MKSSETRMNETIKQSFDSAPTSYLPHRLVALVIARLRSRNTQLTLKASGDVGPFPVPSSDIIEPILSRSHSRLCVSAERQLRGFKNNGRHQKEALPRISMRDAIDYGSMSYANIVIRNFVLNYSPFSRAFRLKRGGDSLGCTPVNTCPVGQIPPGNIPDHSAANFVIEDSFDHHSETDLMKSYGFNPPSVGSPAQQEERIGAHLRVPTNLCISSAPRAQLSQPAITSLAGNLDADCSAATQVRMSTSKYMPFRSQSRRGIKTLAELRRE